MQERVVIDIIWNLWYCYLGLCTSLGSTDKASQGTVEQPYNACVSLLISSRNAYGDKRTLKSVSRDNLGEAKNDTLPPEQEWLCFKNREGLFSSLMYVSPRYF